MNKEEFNKLSDLDKVKYTIEESLKEHSRYNTQYWQGSMFMAKNILQVIEEVKKLNLHVVMRCLPTDEEIKYEADMLSEHPYTSEYADRTMFLKGVNWVKSKIKANAK